MFASLGGILLGVLLGLRHAFEPDHLTAISTLVSEAGGARRGAMLGALWGLGHTISLIVVGSALLVTGAVLPERVGAGFELAVAAMLIVLGARAILRRPAPHPHLHPHAHPHAHAQPRLRALALRPLAVGLVHGLAGSGAITAIVFAELPTLASRIAYIALFGLGSIAGMAIASGVAGASLRAIAGEGRARRGFALATGVLSIAVGVAWSVPQLAML